MGELFDFKRGQECDIFKADCFAVGDQIIYIPDIYLNGIPLARALTDDEIEEVLFACYTGDDFLEECGGNRDAARELFWYCDWQHPSSARGEVEEDDE